jgi:PST family polysaccharide transporter
VPVGKNRATAAHRIFAVARVAEVLLLADAMPDQIDRAAVESSAAAPPAARPTHSTLDRALLHGVAWTAGMKWGTQILSWASTLIVARLLAPADYGLFGMAMVFQGFLAPIYDLGLSAAVIQRRDLSDEQIARLGGLVLLYGAGFSLLTALLAGPIATFYREPAVQWILYVLAAASAIDTLQTLPRALLARQLQFRTIAWIDGFQALATTAVTLALAFAGWGYRALVYGVATGAVLSTAFAVLASPHRYAWPRRGADVGGAMAYGWHVAISRIGWYIYSNADFAIVGRVLGKVALGAYTFGWTIATIPVDRMASLVGRVIPSVFATIQQNAAAMRRYFLGISEGLAFIVLPVSFGLAVTADDFVLLVLGDHWREAIEPLRLLAFYGGVRSLATVMSPVLIATGHAKRDMQFTLIATVVLPPMFYFATRWGTTGVAAAWIVGLPVVSIPAFVFTLRMLHARASDYVKALWPALSASLVMTAVVTLVHLVAVDWPLALRFLAEVLAGIATYGAMVFGFHRGRVDAFRRLLRDARGARPADA